MFYWEMDDKQIAKALAKINHQLNNAATKLTDSDKIVLSCRKNSIEKEIAERGKKPVFGYSR